MRRGSALDGRWEIYEPQKKEFEPVIETPARNHVIIDTSQPVDRYIREIIKKLPRN